MEISSSSGATGSISLPSQQPATGGAVGAVNGASEQLEAVVADLLSSIAGVGGALDVTA